MFVLGARWREREGEAQPGAPSTYPVRGIKYLPCSRGSSTHLKDGTFEDILCRLSSVDKMFNLFNSIII